MRSFESKRNDDKKRLHVRCNFIPRGRRFAADAIFPEIISEIRDALISSDDT